MWFIVFLSSEPAVDPGKEAEEQEVEEQEVLACLARQVQGTTVRAMVSAKQNRFMLTFLVLSQTKVMDGKIF